MASAELVLGPLLRHVDGTTAGIWVETSGPTTVSVDVGGHHAEARTFAVHGHHYALVTVEDLEPGTTTPYTVDVDGERAWPPADSPYPPSTVVTRADGQRLRMLFGSCRTSVSHDRTGNLAHGIDAMRALARTLAEDPDAARPELFLFLGDQVYADETSPEMHDFIASRRSLDEPPGTELKDYTEYAQLYRLAWTDPLNRWLLSTVPSLMIFDDHDVRDDWNTSLTWRQEIQRLPWWHDRIVGAIGSYWVYQHLGNLSPRDREHDPLWQKVVRHQDDGGELDLTDDVDQMAADADEHPDAYRWSYRRDLGDVRLIVIDSRAARCLRPDRRSMLDDEELRWLDDELVGGYQHLVIGTSLPFMLPPGLHHLEAWDEAVAEGAWGERWMGLGERLRQGADLEHWGAFENGFHEVSQMVLEVARGARGEPPATVTFLSGDVHHSYFSEVDHAPPGTVSRITQAVCSPIRNPLPRAIRLFVAFSAYGLAGSIGSALARSAAVPPRPFTWKRVRGPWFKNSVATLDERPDGLWLTWEYGALEGGRDDRPVLRHLATVEVTDPR